MIRQKLKIVFISVMLIFSFMGATSAYALDAKAKALATMALYGTVGGAMLGTASMAFGTSERSIAVGASLGLYVGLIFGGYVVLTHAAKKHNWNFGGPGQYYDDGASPYSEDTPAGDSGGSFFGGGAAQYRQIKRDYQADQSFKKFYNKKTEEPPVFYMNLINYSF